MAQTVNLGGTKLEVGQAQKEATINGLCDLLDASIAGRLAISTTGGTTTLTGTPAAPQAQNLFLDVSGTLTSNAIVEIPVAAGTGRNRIYVAKNGTSGAFTLTVRKVGGTGVAVTQGHTAILLYNDTDIVKLYEVNHTTGVISSANLGGAWASWTPTWTNVDVGNGTVTAKFTQIGKMVYCRLTFILGSSPATPITGQPSFTLPVTSASYAGLATVMPLGPAAFFEGSTVFIGAVRWNSTTAVSLQAENRPTTYVERAVISSTVPFTWAAGDEIHCQFSYEAA